MLPSKGGDLSYLDWETWDMLGVWRIMLHQNRQSFVLAWNRRDLCLLEWGDLCYLE